MINLFRNHIKIDGSSLKVFVINPEIKKFVPNKYCNIILYITIFLLS